MSQDIGHHSQHKKRLHHHLHVVREAVKAAQAEAEQAVTMHNEQAAGTAPAQDSTGAQSGN